MLAAKPRWYDLPRLFFSLWRSTAERELRARLDLAHEKRDESWTALQTANVRLRTVEKLERDNARLTLEVARLTLELTTMREEARFCAELVEAENERRRNVLAAMRPRENV